MTDSASEKSAWYASLAVYTRPRLLAVLFMGFSSGLPLPLTFGTLKAAFYAMLLAAPLVLWGFRDEPRSGASGVSDGAAATGLTVRQALRGYRFWVLLSSVFFAYLAVSGIGPNIIPALTDQGLSPTQAALLQGVYGASIIGARILVGALVDRFWAPGVACLSLLLPVVGCLILSDPAPLWAQGVAMALIGVGHVGRDGAFVVAGCIAGVFALVIASAVVAGGAAILWLAITHFFGG
jgi:hypothetical protein